MDIVQSVWVSLLPGFEKGEWSFETPAELKAFLVKATRNRLVDRVRRNRRSLATEQPLGEVTPDLIRGHGPGPSEEVRASELWARLLELCPPAHRPILTLKREGFGPAEIAERTGLHPSSVRRILYELTRRFGNLQGGGTGQPSSE
jgi:RNA polymerase sigma-70 factor (ECF subfamily)